MPALLGTERLKTEEVEMSRKTSDPLTVICPAERVAGPVDAAGDRLVGRTEAATIIGRSESTLRRLEDEVLKPVVDDNGVHRHSVRRLMEYRVQYLSTKTSPADLDGVVAAAAFELFDAGAGPADAVRALKIHPRAARALHREWADLRGGFFVGAEAAARLLDLPFWNDEPARMTEQVLLRGLEELDAADCLGCSGLQRFCLDCYLRRPPKAQRAAEEAMAARQARADARARRHAQEQAVALARKAASDSSGPGT